MKVLLAGDTHGATGWVKVLCREARDQGCEWIVQLGDYGGWIHTPRGRSFVAATERLLAHYGLKMLTILGNHDPWPVIRKRHPADPETGWGQLGENLWWAERGSRWTWNGVSFMALGGAYSIDAKYRIPGDSWWPEELITQDEADRAMAGGPVDVLLTHDCPAGVDVLGSHHTEDYLYFPQSERNREMLLAVVYKVRPRYVAHGHFHVRNRGYIDIADEKDGQLEWHRVVVDGFACDGMWADSWGVLEVNQDALVA